MMFAPLTFNFSLNHKLFMVIVCFENPLTQMATLVGIANIFTKMHVQNKL